jgi:hypothetical protein
LLQMLLELGVQRIALGGAACLFLG